VALPSFRRLHAKFVGLALRQTWAGGFSAPRLFTPQPYNYMMKTNDDTYIHVAVLAKKLRSKAP
jgi:hypothetical protein